MKLLEFIMNGGVLFMGTLTLIGIGIMLLIGRNVWLFIGDKHGYEKIVRNNNRRIKAVSIFAAIFGLLGQLIGLFSAFQEISAAGGVSMNVLVLGLKISMHPTIYGLVIFLIAHAAVIGMEFKIKKV